MRLREGDVDDRRDLEGWICCGMGIGGRVVPSMIITSRCR